jgi:hypothetical protein
MKTLFLSTKIPHDSIKNPFSLQQKSLPFNKKILPSIKNSSTFNKKSLLSNKKTFFSTKISPFQQKFPSTKVNPFLLSFKLPLCRSLGALEQSNFQRPQACLFLPCSLSDYLVFLV